MHNNHDLLGYSQETVMLMLHLGETEGKGYSPGLVEFLVGIVDSIHCLPDSKLSFLGTFLRKFKLDMTVHCKYLPLSHTKH